MEGAVGHQCYVCVVAVCLRKVKLCCRLFCYILAVWFSGNMLASVNVAVLESMWGSSTVRGCSTPIYFTYLLETQVILFLDWNFPSTANCFELR